MREILTLIGNAARRAVRVYFAPLVWMVKGLAALLMRPFRRTHAIPPVTPPTTRTVRP
jgi:hypothetical protein